MVQNGTKVKINDVCKTFLLPLFLLLYPLRHINQGADITDTGYSAANFLFFDRMDSMWVFATYLANVVGNFFTKLPFGKTMIGMNFYTGLVVSALALCGYFFFTKVIRIPAWIVGIGEIIAISLCWCPTTLLYNYLTYLLFDIGIVLLYQGLVKDKNSLLLGAGICLGANVLVRFPNLAEAGLIVAVWVYGWLKKKKVRKVVQETGWCLLGYVIGIGSILLVIGMKYGFSEYVSGIQRLLAMTDSASDYTVMSMILETIYAYRSCSKWLLLMAVFTAAGFLGFAVLPKRFVKIKQIGYTLGVLVLFRWFMGQGMYNIKYYTYKSIFDWVGIWLLLTMAIICVRTFHPKVSVDEKLLGGLILLLIVITPLGSNNQIYSNINHMFLVAPYSLWLIYRFVTERKSVWEETKILKKGKIAVFFYPAKTMVVLAAVMLLVQSLGFGNTFIFRDSENGEKRDTKIVKNDILKGMYTNQEQAQILEEISEYCTKQGLTGREVLVYGEIPSMPYYLNMPFVLSPWPDLRSYTDSAMERDMESVRERMAADDIRPVIITSVFIKDYLQGDMQAVEAAGVDADKLREEQEQKLCLLQAFISDYKYEETFINDKFVIYE